MPEPFPLIQRAPVDLANLEPGMWQLLGRLDDRFPGGWVLVGGQMVMLLGLEHGQMPRRETVDADALVNVKVMPDGTARISRFLQAEGLELAGIAVDGRGHRFIGDGLSNDRGRAHTIRPPLVGEGPPAPRRQAGLASRPGSLCRQIDASLPPGGTADG